MPALGIGLGLSLQSGAAGYGGPLSDTLARLGLTSGLKLALDAGDFTSWPGTGQQWLDTSGNDQDFFRGASGDAQTSDPTFNGTPGGLSSGEYWSSDGGDYFTLAQANPAWINALHQDNAAFTLLAWVNLAIGSNQGLFGTNGSVLTNHGVYWSVGTTGLQSLNVANGSGTQALQQASANAISTSTWTCIAVSVNESTGASGINWMRNGTFDTDISTYSSPSSSDASVTAQIGSRGNANTPLSNGSRIAMFMAWGVALSQANMTAIFGATRGRFGV